MATKKVNFFTSPVVAIVGFATLYLMPSLFFSRHLVKFLSLIFFFLGGGDIKKRKKKIPRVCYWAEKRFIKKPT